MSVHVLKTLSPYFAAVKRGDKRFEIRRNDRFFQLGDQVDLVEWGGLSYVTHSGKSDFPHDANRLSFLIGPILQGGQFGIEPGWCAFSLMPMQEPKP